MIRLPRSAAPASRARSRRRSAPALAALALAVMLAGGAAPLAAQDARPAAPPSASAVDLLMTPAEQAATGVARLSPAERAALDAWLQRFAAGLQRASAQPMALGGGGGPVEVVLREAIQPPIARVVAVEQGGRYVRLADGTTWEVLLTERPRSAAWSAGDVVRLRRISAPVEQTYDRALENVTTSSFTDVDRSVPVRLVGAR